MFYPDDFVLYQSSPVEHLWIINKILNLDYVF